MKKVIFVHGDKGGVGKSLISSVIIDYYLQNNNDVLIVEGDSVVPDVASRFAYTDGVEGVQATLGVGDYEKAIMNLIDKFEESEHERIIINLPASAGETIDPLAEELGEALSDFDYEINVVFAVGSGADSVNLAQKSLESGLLSIANGKKIAVLNEFFGDPADFEWSKGVMRKKWYQSGGKEVLLPEIAERTRPHIQVGSFSHLASKEGGLKYADRLFLKKWLAKAFEIGDLIEESSDVGVSVDD